MRVLYTLAGLVLLGCGGAMAQPSSAGYGKLKWGATFEEAKELYPAFVTSSEDLTRRRKVRGVDTFSTTHLKSADGLVDLIFERQRFVSVLILMEKEYPGGEPLDVDGITKKITEKLQEKFGSEVHVSVAPTAFDQNSVTLKLEVTSTTVLAEVQKEAAEAQKKIAALMADEFIDSFAAPKTN